MADRCADAAGDRVAGVLVEAPGLVGLDAVADAERPEGRADALEELGIGYGLETDQPGRFYEYPGDPLASGVGTPVSHTVPA